MSPNQLYLANYGVVRPYSNDRELHIAEFDDSRDVVYVHGNEIDFWVGRLMESISYSGGIPYNLHNGELS